MSCAGKAAFGRGAAFPSYAIVGDNGSLPGGLMQVSMLYAPGCRLLAVGSWL
jgi:hypothetical protein